VWAKRGAGSFLHVLGDVYAQHGEGKDRADLSLSGAQQKLFDCMRAAGKPLNILI